MQCIFVPILLTLILKAMQSTQFDYFPILMQLGLAVGFVV